MATIREILEAKNEIALEGVTSLEQLEKIIAEKKKQKKRRPRKQNQPEIRKTYMNRVEREEFMILAAMASKLEEIIEDWEKYNRPRERIKWARSSLTFLYKAIDDCVKGIPPVTVAQIVREVGLCTVGVIEYTPVRDKGGEYRNG